MEEKRNYRESIAVCTIDRDDMGKCALFEGEEGCICNRFHAWAPSHCGHGSCETRPE
jgi:hypothetical protein